MMGMAKEKLCGDCIHADICKKVNGSWYHPKNIAYCNAFKDRKNCVEVVHGQRLYNAHEVAVILADAFGDPCACNFNGNDEWLPEKCELLSACPSPVGVACWEQYLKYRDAKMDGDGK